MTFRRLLDGSDSIWGSSILDAPKSPRRRPSRIVRPKGHYYRDADGRLHSVIDNRRTVAADCTMFVSLDLAQANDFTACIVVERKEDGLSVRHVERTRDMSYPDIVAAISNLMAQPALKDAKLLVDRTGVGRPVYDLLTKERLDPAGITITSGDRARGKYRNFRVPKKDLVNAVLIALQTEQLSIASDIPCADLLKRELASMRARLTASGNTQFEAAPGEHDDLVMALAMAVWFAEHRRR